MKTVYGWVVYWPKPVFPSVSIDLFFTSKESFEKVCSQTSVIAHKEVLVPIPVPDDFNDLDYIPDNY
ncbi:MAG: hypothetical protein WC471_06125 [Candidatus Woesearchaeota archaeon]|jgi:hypothetical protein